MSNDFPPEGTLREGDIFPVLYHFYKNSISGLLVVKSEGVERKILIENRKVNFVSSTSFDESLGSFLIREKVLEREAYDKVNDYITKHHIRFGRGLIELRLLNYEQLWKWVRKHLLGIIQALFAIKAGEYQIIPGWTGERENILLEKDITAMIIEGLREFRSVGLLKRKFETIENLYIFDSSLISRLDLKPYEFHIYDLCCRYEKLEEILQRSELLSVDTLRVLFLFLVLEIVTPDIEKQEKVKTGTTQYPGKQNALAENETQYAGADGYRQDNENNSANAISNDHDSDSENMVSAAAFKSFDEALKHYNGKYESIYRVLSKEIGPIALSILARALDDISENLPAYFQKIKLMPNGSINEEFLRSVWHHDFNKHGPSFLRGLEEILYAEIYMIKKHLGVDQEQQVLKWLNRTGM